MNNIMYCPNCGNKISGEENFCSSCGYKLNKAEIKSDDKDNSKEDIKKEGKDEFPKALWDKFLEVVKAEGEEKEKYQKLSSDAAVELITRLYTNAFNGLMEEFKIDLDKQPYKAIEAIKENLLTFTLSSYQLYIAEKLLKEGDFKKAKITDVESLAKEWKKVYLNFNNKITIIPQDAITVLDAIDAQLGENPFNDSPSLKELPKAVVDAIKNEGIRQLINGYLLGVAENNIREEIKM